MNNEFSKLIMSVVCLVYPPSLFAIAYPSLSSMELKSPELAYLPSAVTAVLIIFCVISWFGAGYIVKNT